MPERRSVEELVAEAREKIARYEPPEAAAAVRDGALIVDIRGDLDRETNGVVPGALHIPRTVLEWRLDPASPWRNPGAAELDRQIIVLCDHGYSSSFAAAMLVELGFPRAGDVVGGFEAWVQQGLPVAKSPRRRQPGELPGMGEPD